MIEMLAASLTVRAIGWALLQSIWQGAVVCGVTATVLLALRRRTAKARYAAACGGLVFMLAVPVVTATGYLRELQANDGQPLAEQTRVVATNVATNRAARTVPNAAPAPPAAALTGIVEVTRTGVAVWPAAVVLIWATGVLLLSLRLFRSWLIVERIRRTAVQPVPATWQARVTAMAHRLRVMRPVRAVESSFVETPVVIGWLRPVILIPASALTGLSPAQLEAIIAHELAHVQRHDYLVNLLQTVVETLLFHHPGTWWLSRQIRLEREHCCDDVAVMLCNDRAEYARALANLEELRHAGPNLGLSATGGPLERRVRRVLGASIPDRHQSALWVGVWLMAAALAFVFQDAQLRGAATQLTQTSGGLRGQVLDARSGKPVAGAAINVSRAGDTGSAVSAGDGRYEIRGLAPGEYLLFVRAEGFVEAQYGQRQPGEDGRAIEIRSGQIASGIDVRLQSSGIVDGRILGDAGEGLPNVEIELMTERYLPGGPEPVPVGFARTDASGAFRVGGLTPGEYDVRAYVQPDVRPQRDDASQVYAPTYFPGVTRIEEAQPILVAAGQEVFDVHFPLAKVTTRVVAGTLAGPPTGSFDRMRVALMRQGGGATFNQTVSVSSNGSFQFRNVIPGDYLLTVLGAPQDLHWHWAMQPIAVDGDVSDVELAGRRNALVEGRIVRDGGGPLPFDPRAVGVGFEQRTERRPGIADLIQVFNNGRVVREDGTFSIESPGGPSFVRISDVPAGWTVKAIRMDGVDVTDQAVELGDAAPRQVEVVLTNRIANVIGVVTDRNGRAVSNYTVVVFPEDRNRWKPPSRLVRGVRPHNDGSYRIEDLPPANYRAVAVDSLPRNAWIDPNVLETLWSSSIQFRVNEGEQRAMNLRLSSK